MTTQDIGLLQALKAKMDYLGQRQSVLSQNVANADTPGYRPQDLVEVDFARYLNIGNEKGKPTSVSMAATDDQHIGNPGNTETSKASKQKKTYEVAPTGNAVILEEQLLKSSQNVMDYNLMINLYQKQIGMLRTALGSRG